MIKIRPESDQSLYTNIPALETIHCFIEQIYIHKKNKTIYTKFIFATKCKFTFPSTFYKEIDGCIVRP